MLFSIKTFTDINSNKLILAKSSKDFYSAKEEGKTGVLLGFQNATMIENSIENIKSLLKAGADASLRDDDGETALHKAHKFIKQERRRRHEEKVDGFDEKTGVEMKFEKIVKALVAACPEATTVANRRGEKPGEAV